MLLKIFAIYDSKSELFEHPFYDNTLGSAMRRFMDLIADKNSYISQHPGDFTLFELGTFDNCSGRFEALKTPVSRGLAIEFVRDVSITANGVDPKVVPLFNDKEL